MSEWIDVREVPLPEDINHPMFAVDWPLLWVCCEPLRADVEVEMAVWAPDSVTKRWQFTEYPGSDEFGSYEVKNVRWYQPIVKPEPPK